MGVFMLAGTVFMGCEDAARLGKTFKASTIGIEREVVWTGFDGSKRVWRGKFKVDSEGGVVYFVKDGKTVILGSGWYSEEK